MSIGLVLALYAIWSSVFSLGKLALAHSPPIFFTGCRTLLAGSLLVCYLGVFRRKEFRLSLRQWASICLMGFFSCYLSNILEFWALQYLSATKTCFIYSLCPSFTALLSYIHFRERMNGRKWLGITIGLFAMLPVLMTQEESEGLFHPFGHFSWPTLAMVGAVFCAVYGWVLMRLIVKDAKISPLMTNGIGMLFGGLVALGHSAWIDGWSPTPVTPGKWGTFALSTVLVTAISNLLCYNLYGHMLKRYTATFLSLAGLISPVFSALNAWVLLGESVSWPILLSTAIVGVGMWLVYSAELKQGYIVKKPISLTPQPSPEV